MVGAVVDDVAGCVEDCVDDLAGGLSQKRSQVRNSIFKEKTATTTKEHLDANTPLDGNSHGIFKKLFLSRLKIKLYQMEQSSATNKLREPHRSKSTNQVAAVDNNSTNNQVLWEAFYVLQDNH